MTALASNRLTGSRRAGSRRTRDERGYALIAVLVVIAVTSVLVTALMAMMMTTLRIAERQERNARERRAADGAIEVALAEMRDRPCDPSQSYYLQGIGFDQGTPGTGDDITVDVDCSSDDSLGADGNDQVRILGNDPYDGSLAGPVDCTAALVEGCLPWSSVFGSVPGGLDDIALVHTGHEALRFNTGVSVRSGGVGLRNDSGGSPAITTGGPYTQGSLGAGATPGNACGVLDDLGGLNGATAVHDSDGTPECDSAEARDLVLAAPQVPQPGPAQAVAAAAVPACTSPVVAFVPGAYDAAATAAVSARTSGSNPACVGRTFHFVPGIYSFDGTLALGGAGSSHVFGAPSGWDPAAGVQASPAASQANARLCDTNVSGATLVLSATSELVHTGGRVSVCPAFPGGGGDPHPAISQSATTPTSVSVDTSSLPIQRTFETPLFGPLTVSKGYPTGSTGLPISATGSTLIEKASVYVTGTEGDNSQNNFVTNRKARFAVYNSAGVLCRTAWVEGLPNSGMAARYDLLTGDCATKLAGKKVSDLNGLSIFFTGEVTLENTLIKSTLAMSDIQIAINEEEASIDAADLAGAQWTDVANAAVADGAYANPVMPCSYYTCEVNDPGRTRGEMFAHEFSLGSFNSQLLTEASSSGAVPELTQLRVNVQVSTQQTSLPSWWPGVLGSNPQHFRPRMTTTVTMTAPGGEECRVRQGFDDTQAARRSTGGVNSRQVLSFDLLHADAQGDCGPVRNAVAGGQDVTSKVLFELPCVYINPVGNAATNAAKSCVDDWPLDKVYQVRPPSIDRFFVSVATDTYTGDHATSQVRIDARNEASSSSFNVYGKTWMPRTDLDIRWLGGVTSDPLFADDLVVNGLGSVMGAGAQMGTVCCSPPESRTVEVTAWINGVERLVTRAEFTDVDDGGNYSPGHRVDVLRWLDCTESCTSVLSASDTRDPVPAGDPAPGG